VVVEAAVPFCLSSSTGHRFVQRLWDCNGLRIPSFLWEMIERGDFADWKTIMEGVDVEEVAHFVKWLEVAHVTIILFSFLDEPASSVLDGH
jgi:hypothetical protein